MTETARKYIDKVYNAQYKNQNRELLKGKISQKEFDEQVNNLKVDYTEKIKNPVKSALMFREKELNETLEQQDIRLNRARVRHEQGKISTDYLNRITDKYNKNRENILLDAAYDREAIQHGMTREATEKFMEKHGNVRKFETEALQEFKKEKVSLKDRLSKERTTARFKQNFQDVKKSKFVRRQLESKAYNMIGKGLSVAGTAALGATVLTAAAPVAVAVGGVKGAGVVMKYAGKIAAGTVALTGSVIKDVAKISSKGLMSVGNKALEVAKDYRAGKIKRDEIFSKNGITTSKDKYFNMLAANENLLGANKGILKKENVKGYVVDKLKVFSDNFKKFSGLRKEKSAEKTLNIEAVKKAPEAGI